MCDAHLGDDRSFALQSIENGAHKTDAYVARDYEKPAPRNRAFLFGVGLDIGRYSDSRP